MNKFYFCFLCVISAFYPNISFGIENIYLRGDLGFSQSTSIKSDQLFYKESGNRKFKDGFASSIGLGYKFNRCYRVELAYNRVDNLKYDAQDVTLVKAGRAFKSNYSQKLKLQALMFNFYYNIPLESRFTPYLGLGLGYSKISSNNASRFTKETNFTKSYEGKDSKNISYALMLGGMVKINEKFDADIGYKFQDFGKNKGFNYMILNNTNRSTITNSASGYRVKVQSITFGIKYNF